MEIDAKKWFLAIKNGLWLGRIGERQSNNSTKRTVHMKGSKAAIHRKTHRIPEIKFEDQRLTSFAGLVVYQSLFSRIGLKQQLSGCFRHLAISPIFGHGC